ncbi:MAG TPA: hypothetical protein VIJ25_04445, partial [Methylococcales bacterium]
FVAASDICFAGATPEDVVVIEPPHRGDDPMRAVRPTLAHAIKPYFGYSTADKTRLISRIVQETSDISNS